MNIRVHHLDKWAFINMDLIGEILEKRKRCAVTIGGATSSGKSFSAEYLETFLNANKVPAIIVSTDNYNKGISGIVTDKVDEKLFKGMLPNKEKVKAVVRQVIVDTPFEEKFAKKNRELIRQRTEGLLSPSEQALFLKGCVDEIKKLSFDEPSVYDLKEVASDVKSLLKGKVIQRKKYSKVASERLPVHESINGSRYRVIIIEGIYATTDDLIKELERKYLITNFVEGNPKSLFLRRVIRDQKNTSLPNYVTIAMYFNYIAKSYKESIRPSSANADVILDNNMSFAELREGTLYTTKEKIKVTNPEFLARLWQSSKTVKTVYQKDLYIKGQNEPRDLNSIIRMREISSDKGRTFVPVSLISKGVPKYRRDHKEIRPINILLAENEFHKVFASEQDFVEKIATADFAVDQVVKKIKRYLNYKGYRLILTDIPGSGVYLELSDPKIEPKTREWLLQRATS